MSLRVAAQLRRLGISLQQIRRVDAHLRKLDYSRPLAQLGFFVAGDHLYFEEAGTVRAGAQPEQVIASYAVPVGQIAHQLAGQIAKLRERPHGAIERRRGTLGGRPVIQGTRVTVDSIRRLSRQGADEAEILASYPDLTPEDVRAALASEAPPRPRQKAGFLWRDHKQSAANLGYAETVRQLKRRLETCHPSARGAVQRDLEMAERGEGPTVFDWLVEIIEGQQIPLALA